MAPNLCTTLKLHKQNTLIRPIVNWRNSPAYEIAKYVTKTLHICLHILNTYNIQSSIHLTTYLKSIEINVTSKCFHCFHST
jgi:hypothetical protein